LSRDLGKVNVINAQSDFTARKLIGNVERVLLKHNELERYDVYCEWWDNEPNSYKIWLRDRLDDSRIGPFDAEYFMKNSSKKTYNKRDIKNKY